MELNTWKLLISGKPQRIGSCLEGLFYGMTKHESASICARYEVDESKLDSLNKLFKFNDPIVLVDGLLSKASIENIYKENAAFRLLKYFRGDIERLSSKVKGRDINNYLRINYYHDAYSIEKRKIDSIIKGLDIRKVELDFGGIEDLILLFYIENIDILTYDRLGDPGNGFGVINIVNRLIRNDREIANLFIGFLKNKYNNPNILIRIYDCPGRKLLHEEIKLVDII